MMVAFGFDAARSPPSIQNKIDPASALSLDQAQTRLIDRNARTHGRGHGQLLQIDALRRGRLDILKSSDQRQEVFLQCRRLETGAADLRVHDARLVGSVSDLPGL